MKNVNVSVIYFIVFLFYTCGVYLFIPLKKIIQPPYNWLGVLFIVFGMIVNLVADSVLKQTKKSKNKEISLHKTGLFRISRNPMYLGMVTVLIGVSIFFSSVTSVLGPIIFYLLIEKLIIPKEEKELENQYGKEYLSYKKTTRRWM
ncbi:MAG: isoprenylcysteine carboxylmethyltransferase family protein [Caldisericia bacterium]|nr:isoprenylcysteine carboxylmethyltransferase family protein [Caldisericia bacterium]